uniref:Uncharacterized protein n=1 Tax=Romanomermis culicivorax TaxID=13658 RepID=A0A915KH37_ROMCU
MGSLWVLSEIVTVKSLKQLSDLFKRPSSRLNNVKPFGSKDQESIVIQINAATSQKCPDIFERNFSSIQTIFGRSIFVRSTRNKKFTSIDNVVLVVIL